MVVSIDKSKVIKQLEYYFGPVNLLKDKFLRKELTDNENCVSFDTLLKFNRLKELVNDKETLKSTLEDVESEYFEKTETGLKPKNVPDLCQEENINEKFGKQSIHVKGLPKEFNLDAGKEWLDSLNYEYLSIYLRKNPADKKFKGSIFITFKDEETAKRFLEDEEIKKYKDNFILKEWQQECYNAEMESKAKRKQKSEAKLEEKRQTMKDSIAKDVLLRILNLPTKEENESMKITDFKEWLIEKLGDLGKGLWIDIKPEENSAIVKLKENGAADKAIEMFKETPLEYKEKKLELVKVPETEEIDYLIQNMERNNNRRGKRPNRGGFNGGRGNKRRRN